MATVTALADRASQVTGLATTEAERALIVAALNDAYVKAVEETEAYNVTSSAKSLTSGTADYELSASPISLTDILRIKAIVTTGGGRENAPLTRRQEDYLLSLREGGGGVATGAVVYYATAGTNTLRLYPTPGAGVTLTFHYIGTPPTLVESGAVAGEETTPSKIPARFHWDVIGAGAIAEALLKDQRVEDAMFWMQRYEQGVMALRRWVNEFGGEPAPVPFATEYPHSLDPDQRGRV